MLIFSKNKYKKAIRYQRLGIVHNEANPQFCSIKNKQTDMKTIFSILFTLLFSISFAQTGNLNFLDMNSGDRLKEQKSSKVKIGGYGQIDYNQPLVKDTKNPGNLDVHRVILFFGYSFSPKWELITELEFEHVKEVFVEQAYLSYKLNKYVSFKGGLLLIPMGYINEFHEPTAFFGVERPLLDSKVVPTTWREIGLGVYGRIPELSLKYQLYVVNGFMGYNGVAKLDGDDAYRGGRQKGAKSTINHPNLSAKIDIYGIKRLKIGLSTYLGKTQSSLFNGLSTSNEAGLLQADSSVVSIRMFGLDAAYNNKGLQLRGQAIYSFNKNVDAYNEFGSTDLGKEVFGYYLEAAYNVFNHLDKTDRLMPFVRYENFDTHFVVNQGEVRNPKNHRQAWFAGINYYPTEGIVLKADFQWVKTDLNSEADKGFNLGIGYMF